MKKFISKSINQSFFRHKQENEQIHNVVNRSSAIFYFINSPNVSTEIHFLNYWKEKRALTDINLKLTFRTMRGELFHESNEKIEKAGSHIKSIKSILNIINNNIEEGSIELEFTSRSNMFISYPAVIVRYIGKNWHTSAHSSQRIFSKSSGDGKELLSGKLFIAEEGNICIPDNDSSPFFIVHNGPIELPSQDIEHKVIREDGKQKIFIQKDIKFKPYETKLFRLKKIYEYKKFAQDKLVTFTIKFLTSGVFSRLIAGFEKSECWSIDHTNFAATTGSPTKDFFIPNNVKDFKNLVFNLPFQPDWNNFVLIPPSYPLNESYEVTMNEINKEGKIIKKSKVVCGRNKEQKSFPKFCFNNKSNNPKINPEFIFFNKYKLPKRFHMVVSYQKGKALPGFVVEGPTPYTTPEIRTRWLPLFGNNCENYIIIANQQIGFEAPQDITFLVNLFNNFNELPLQNNLFIKAFECKHFHISELFPNYKDYLKEKTGWLYLVADKKQRCNIHYASVLSESIACDHAF